MARTLILCVDCGCDTSGSYVCCDLKDGEWCPECHDKTACGRQEAPHGEGCATFVSSFGSEVPGAEMPS